MFPCWTWHWYIYMLISAKWTTSTVGGWWTRGLMTEWSYWTQSVFTPLLLAQTLGSVCMMVILCEFYSWFLSMRSWFTSTQERRKKKWYIHACCQIKKWWIHSCFQIKQIIQKRKEKKNRRDGGWGRECKDSQTYLQSRPYANKLHARQRTEQIWDFYNVICSFELSVLNTFLLLCLYSKEQVTSYPVQLCTTTNVPDYTELLSLPLLGCWSVRLWTLHHRCLLHSHHQSTR